jgi:pimeloyl-ACP methyl ester carboxylesterase
VSKQHDGANVQNSGKLVRLGRRGFLGAALGTMAMPSALVSASDKALVPSPGTVAEGPLAIARQGSLYLAGKKMSVPGKFDPNGMPMGDLKGDSYWAHQVYVQFQTPAEQRGLPIVMLHGAGQTGVGWDSTPDGREGFRSLFLRRGHPVYTVDLPHAGRGGAQELSQICGFFSHAPIRGGIGGAFVLSRLGPKPFEFFPNSQFPRKGFEAFCRQSVPFIDYKPEFFATALGELTARIGPVILFTHSNSGMTGWLATMKNPKVKGVVAFEPGGFVYPDRLPALPPLHNGFDVPLGKAVPKAEFSALAKIPIQVVMGDNIPRQPVAAFAQDIYRIASAAGDAFVSALHSNGGKASVLSLPREGLRGNSHFAFLDLNNVAVAELVGRFIRQNVPAT